MAIAEEVQTVPVRSIPFPMGDPYRVPPQRYFDREFFELEKKHLWPRVWQMACRLEEIPVAGDFVEYEICDQSILVVRQADMSVKAFYNACRHRATELCKGTGRLPGGQIVCPFHGWRWNIDGSSSFVYAAAGFDPQYLQPSDIRLQECRAEIFAACVWINMDPQARSLQEYMAPVKPMLDAVGVDNMRVWWWKETVVRANWKMAQEAFQEGFHVMASHPQLTMGVGEDYPWEMVEYMGLANGHGRFGGKVNGRGGGPSSAQGADAFISRARALWEGQDAMTLERDIHVFEGIRNQVPPGEDFASAAIKALYEYAAGAGIPFTPRPEAAHMWGGEIYMFPNFFFLPQFENALSYRARPYNDDPEWCRFEVWSLTMYPEGHEPGRAQLGGRFEPDDKDNWGLIPRQDFSNMARQQRGVHSRSFDGHRLARDVEDIISNTHQELDRYLMS